MANQMNYSLILLYWLLALVKDRYATTPKSAREKLMVFREIAFRQPFIISEFLVRVVRLLIFYVLATSKVILGCVLTFDNVCMYDGWFMPLWRQRLQICNNGGTISK